MKPRNLFLLALAALLILGCGTADAGQTITEAGTIVCVNDKWDGRAGTQAGRLRRPVREGAHRSGGPEGHRECVGNYEYMPDGSWKGAGTCTRTVAGGDKMYEAWQESSDLKEYPYKHTGGTGKYEGASGGARITTGASPTPWPAALTRARRCCPTTSVMAGLSLHKKESRSARGGADRLRTLVGGIASGLKSCVALIRLRPAALAA
jgi:hypothetical protein